MKKIKLISVILSIALLCGCRIENNSNDPTEEPELTPTATPINTGVTLKIEESSPYYEMVKNMGFTISQAGTKTEINVGSLDGDLGECKNEGYKIEATNKNVTITVESEKGAYYGLKKLAQLVEGKEEMGEFSVKEAPSFELRGVIEGFYGEPWTHDFRLRLMDFMGNVKMNMYIYAPKDDLKHRAKWREMYTDSELKQLGELVNKAKSNYVSFVFAISPGVDIDLATNYDNDFNQLCEKCQQLYDLGVRDFAILLDDIQTLDARGHAKLLNDFDENFVKTHEGVNKLITVLTEYTDTMITDYSKEIGPLINEDIRIMWTGPMVIGTALSSPALIPATKLYNRKVLVWWNYPVNDFDVNSIFMDACRRINSKSGKSMEGLISNPMNQGEASLVPLYTIADFLWDAENYDPDKSLAEAVKIIDPELTTELLTFIEYTNNSMLSMYKSSKTMTELLKNFDENNYNEEVINNLIAESEKICNVEKLLHGSNTEFVKEVKNWIVKTAAYGKMAKSYFEIIKEKNGANDQSKIDSLNKVFNENKEIVDSLPNVVSPDCLEKLFK